MNQSVPFLSVTQATPVQTSRPVRSKTSLVHRAVHQRLRRLLAMFFLFITVPALGQEQLAMTVTAMIVATPVFSIGTDRPGASGALTLMERQRVISQVCRSPCQRTETPWPSGQQAMTA